MEEKVLVKGQQYRVKKFFRIMIILGLVLSIVLFALLVADNMSWYERCYRNYVYHRETGSCGSYYDSKGMLCYYCEEIEPYDSKLDYAFSEVLNEEVYMLVMVLFAVSFAAIGALVYFWLRRCEVTVTDRRIYGRVGWGKQVDIPLEAVSAVAAAKVLKGVRVTTASGKIHFRMVRNAGEICRIITELMHNRQQIKQNSLAKPQVPENHGSGQKQAKPQKQTGFVKTASPEADAFEQIKKYKELLDMGIITQEEFDRKKKQLLKL